MGFCGVLDQAIDVTKDHFGKLFPVMMALQLPVTIACGIWLQSSTPVPLENPTPEQSMEFGQQAIRWLPMLYVVQFVNIIANSLSNSLMITTLSGLYLGQPTHMGSAIRQSISRFLSLFGTTLLFWIPCIMGMFCCLFPGAIYFVFFGLCTEVVMLERIGGFNALVRAYRLKRYDWLRMIALCFFLVVILYAVNLTSILVPQQLYLRVVVISFISTAFQLWATAVWVVFYYSCRSGLENFDLFYLANSIAVESDDATEQSKPHVE